MNRAGYSVVLYLICCIYGRLASRKNPHSFNSPFHPERSNISRKLLVEESVDVAVLGFLIFIPIARMAPRDVAAEDRPHRGCVVSSIFHLVHELRASFRARESRA